MRQCFIISQPRAGSTLLQRLLGTHPQVQTIGEPWLAIPFVYALREKGVSSEYIHVSLAQGFGEFVSKLPGGRADYFREVRAMLERLQQKISAPGKTCFLDKTPRYHLILDELAQIFPDAKFIVLWRNPLAIVASILNTWKDGRFDLRVVSQASGELQTSIALSRSVDELLSAAEQLHPNVRSAAAVRAFTPDQPDTPPPPVPAPSRLGQELFDLLFSPPEVSRALAECMTDARNNKAGVRLKFTLNTRDAGVADLARLPWELLHDETKYKYFALRPESPIVRYLEVPKPFEVTPFAPPLRILVVSANPRQDLALDQERANLKATLDANGEIELEFVDQATIQSIAAALTSARMAGRDIHVVHFMGHGDFRHGRGVLLLHNQTGGEDQVDAEAFATALQAGGAVRLVFLNACNTAQSSAQSASGPFAGVASSLVFEGVPAVVAMQRPVPDDAAVVLAKHFYACIAKGWAVDAALSEGRLQMYYARPEHLDWGIPVLFMRAPDGLLFDVAPVVVPSAAVVPTPAPVTVPAPMPVAAPRAPSRVKAVLLGVGLTVAALVALALFIDDSPQPPVATEQSGAGATPSDTAPAGVEPLDEARVAALTATATANTNDIAVRVELAELLASAGRWNDALPWYEAASRLAPKDATLSTLLGEAYQSTQQPDEALAQYDLALRLDPAHVRAMYSKGIILLERDDESGAVALWTKITETAPGTPDAEMAEQALQILRTPASDAPDTTFGKVKFSLANDTGFELEEVFLSPNNVDDWGANQLGTVRLPARTSRLIAFMSPAAGWCSWDFMTHDPKGVQLVWNDVDLCGETAVTLVYKNGTPSVRLGGR